MLSLATDISDPMGFMGLRHSHPNHVYISFCGSIGTGGLGRLQNPCTPLTADSTGVESTGPWPGPAWLCWAFFFLRCSECPWQICNGDEGRQHDRGWNRGERTGRNAIKFRKLERWAVGASVEKLVWTSTKRALRKVIHIDTCREREGNY